MPTQNAEYVALPFVQVTAGWTQRPDTFVKASGGVVVGAVGGAVGVGVIAAGAVTA
jgi:hypothetical protein